MIPLIIDGITQYSGIRESNNPLRFISGVTAGIAISLLAKIFSKFILLNFLLDWIS